MAYWPVESEVQTQPENRTAARFRIYERENFHCENRFPPLLLEMMEAAMPRRQQQSQNTPKGSA